MTLYEDSKAHYTISNLRNLSERHKRSLEVAMKFLLSENVRQELKRVYLYGSVARGEASYNSDVDLLLVVNEDTTPKYMRWIRSCVLDGDYTLPEVDIHFTKDESLDNLSWQFAENVRKDGVVLWEKN